LKEETHEPIQTKQPPAKIISRKTQFFSKEMIQEFSSSLHILPFDIGDIESKEATTIKP
jgi:hypothetical protein